MQDINGVTRASHVHLQSTSPFKCTGNFFPGHWGSCDQSLSQCGHYCFSCTHSCSTNYRVCAESPVRERDVTGVLFERGREESVFLPLSCSEVHPGGSEVFILLLSFDQLSFRGHCIGGTMLYLGQTLDFHGGITAAGESVPWFTSTFREMRYMCSIIRAF